MTELTPQEIKNGWTVQSLEAYQRERDIAAALTSGNVITSFTRAKPATRIENTKNYSPHNW